MGDPLRDGEEHISERPSKEQGEAGVLSQGAHPPLDEATLLTLPVTGSRLLTKNNTQAAFNTFPPQPPTPHHTAINVPTYRQEA